MGKYPLVLKQQPEVKRASNGSKQRGQSVPVTLKASNIRPVHLKYTVHTFYIVWQGQ